MSLTVAARQQLYRALKPFSLIVAIAALALTIPEHWARRARGAAAWSAGPLWRVAQEVSTPAGAGDAPALRLQHLEAEVIALREQLQSLSGEQTPSVGQLARVLAREPGAWHRFLWLDLGRETAGLSSPLERHAPVVMGSHLVGIVDYVGRRQTLVRLLTDPQCCPAVALATDAEKDGLAEAAARLQQLLRRDIRLPAEQKHQLQHALGMLEQRRSLALPLLHGLLEGSKSGPEGPLQLEGHLFRSECAQIQNMEGWRAQLAGHPVLSTGLDGVFPKGYLVGFLLDLHVDEASPLLTFRLQPAADLQRLQWVTILPKRSFDQRDRPLPPWQTVLTEAPSV